MYKKVESVVKIFKWVELCACDSLASVMIREKDKNREIQQQLIKVR